VTRLFRALRRWLGGLPIADPLQRRHAVTLQVFALALALAAVVAESVRVATGHFSLAVLAINGVNAALCLTAVMFLRRGHYHRAAVLFVAGYGAVQAIAYSLGGLQFSRDGLKNIGLGLTLAALLAGRRALWAMLGVFTTAMIVAYARDLGYLGGAGPGTPPGTPGGLFWTTVASFLVLAIVLDRFGLTVRESLADRRRAEKALRNSEELFRVAFQSSPNSINISRLDGGVYMAVNAGFTRLTGWPADEAVGRTSEEMGLWVDRDARDRAINDLLREGVVHDFQARFRRRDGSEFPGSLFAQRFDLGGRPHVLAVTRDLTASRAAETERALLQAQLLQAQKLESIGRVAGGVAHDLNNLLTAVLGYTDLLDRSLVSDAQRADLGQIRLGGQRAASLTRQLLSFARKQPIEPRDVEVDALIENLGGLLRGLLGAQIEFVVRFTDPGCAVRADPGQLEQVVLNLVVNARDAMAAGGRLCIETRALAAAQVASERVPGLTIADHVVIAVTDTGSGMTPEVVQHLFEPFFTTKGPGKGTGLGLATCYGIVRQAGGQIAVTTGPGKGSTFRVYLPRLPDSRPQAADAAAVPPSAGGSEVVLVVEDDPQLRALVTRILRGQGYRVLEAGDGVQGQLAAAAHDGEIDLLFTDVVMPRLGGRELAQQLRATRPRLRVLFTSGYTEKPLDDDEASRLLQKPFTAAALLHRVRQALDA
jgi:PAS domain S-box-containing protein